VTENSKILENCTKFYKNLYKSDNLNKQKIKQYLETINITNKLKFVDAHLCEGNITLAECRLYKIK
jgi:hypothetical protein